MDRCKHEIQVEANVIPHDFLDQINIDIVMSCTHCKKRFKFVGLIPGTTVSLDGFEAHLTIEPEEADGNRL